MALVCSLLLCIWSVFAFDRLLVFAIILIVGIFVIYVRPCCYLRYNAALRCVIGGDMCARVLLCLLLCAVG